MLLSVPLWYAIHGLFRASLLCEVLLKSAKVPKTLLATFWPSGCRGHFFAMYNSRSGKQHIPVLPCPCCDVLSQQPRIAHGEKAKKTQFDNRTRPLAFVFQSLVAFVVNRLKDTYRATLGSILMLLNHPATGRALEN